MNKWLFFLPQTPASPSSLRVLVWRRLQQAGAINVGAGAWVLPHTREHEQTFEKLLKEIEQQGGSAYSLEATASEKTETRLIERFQSERAQDYQEFGERCQEFLQEIEKETGVRKFTFAELEENEQDLLKLTRWLRKIQQRDFFRNEASQEATEQIARCRVALHAFTTAVYEQAGLPLPLEEDTLRNVQEQE
jgi:hypothetical protein